MRTITIKGRDGRRRTVTLHGNSNYVLEDGETLVVPPMFMDGFGRGYAFADDDVYVVTDADRQRVEDARSGWIDRVSKAWKGRAKAGPIPITTLDDGDPREAAIAAYEQRLTDAWRSPR